MRRLAGYVKLAKLWERDRFNAMNIQHEYYRNLTESFEDIALTDVYVDITGEKSILKRPEMIRLLKDVRDGNVDIIYTQTRGYLAANLTEFCYLIAVIAGFGNNADIITEDVEYNINTMMNIDDQKQEMLRMSEKIISLDRESFEAWRDRLFLAMKERNDQ